MLFVLIMENDRENFDGRSNLNLNNEIMDNLNNRLYAIFMRFKNKLFILNLFLCVSMCEKLGHLHPSSNEEGSTFDLELAVEGMRPTTHLTLNLGMRPAAHLTLNLGMRPAAHLTSNLQWRGLTPSKRSVGPARPPLPPGFPPRLALAPLWMPLSVELCYFRPRRRVSSRPYS